MIRLLLAIIAALGLTIILDVAGVIHLHPCDKCAECPKGTLLPEIVAYSGTPGPNDCGGQGIDSLELIKLMGNFKMSDCDPGKDSVTQVFFSYQAINWLMSGHTTDNGFWVVISRDDTHERNLNAALVSGNLSTLKGISTSPSNIGIKGAVVCPIVCWP